MEMKTLLIGDQELILDVLSLALEGSLDADITVVSGVDEAMKVINTGDRPLDLLVYDVTGGSGKQISQLLTTKIPVFALVANDSKFPQDFETEKNLHFVYKPVHLVSLIDAVKGVLPKLFSKDKGQNFCKIKLETLLLSGNMFAFDVYIKISDEKFTKILSQGDRFNISDYAHYSVKKLKYLYLRQTDFVVFMNKFAEELQSIMADASKPFNIETAIDISMSVHEMIHDAIPELGFTPELQQIAKVSIDLAVNSIKKNPKISELLAPFMEDKSSYIHWHSTALCYIACLLSSKMTWDSDNTHFKLALASILHDITLKDHDTATILSPAELKKRIVDPAEQSAYLQHPITAASLARDMKDFPGDVDHILAQHHEMPDGSGFPLKINHTKISPLSALFIIAHHMTYELYQKKEKFVLSEYLTLAAPIFNKGYFKKIMTKLMQLAEL
jgi:HD-GYP domain-containing protein (c-di-GMP phosphodiesterase class II)